MRLPAILMRLLAALAGSAALACQSNADDAVKLAALSDSCLIDSDCDALLVCAFQRCHQECNSSRDCSASARCVSGARQRHVCQLEEEQACSKAGKCAGTEVCGVDAKCRDACSTDSDCLAEQRCRGGTCADERELDAAGQLPVDPRRPDAPPPPCSFDSECPDSLVCDAGTCRAQCATDADCPSGDNCTASRCVATPKPRPACWYNSDCAQGSACVDGACQKLAGSKLECAYDSDCKTAGQRCRSGVCACECSSALDCGPSYTCEGNCQCVPSRVIAGDVTVQNTADARALAEVTEITGQLILQIEGPASEVHLPNLKKLGQLIIAALPTNRSTYVFDALEEVTYDVRCYGDCRLPVLRKSGGLDIQQVSQTTLSFPALETTTGGVNVSFNSELRQVELPLLKHALALSITSNDKLLGVNAPLLTQLDSVNAQDNRHLQELILPKAAITANISLQRNAALLRAEFGTATYLAWIQIDDNPLLESLSFPALVRAALIQLATCPKLTSWALPLLAQVDTDIRIDGSSTPAELSLPELASAGTLHIWLSSMPTSLVAPKLTTLNTLTLNSTSLQRLELPALTRLDAQLELVDNTELEAVSLPQLKLAGAITVSSSPKLTALDLHSLQTMGNLILAMTGLSNLNTLDPALGGALTSAGNVSIGSNPALSDCATASLADSLANLNWLGSFGTYNNKSCATSCVGAVCQ